MHVGEGGAPSGDGIEMSEHDHANAGQGVDEDLYSEIVSAAIDPDSSGSIDPPVAAAIRGADGMRYVLQARGHGRNIYGVLRSGLIEHQGELKWEQLFVHFRDKLIVPEDADEHTRPGDECQEHEPQRGDGCQEHEPQRGLVGYIRLGGGGGRRRRRIDEGRFVAARPFKSGAKEVWDDFRPVASRPAQ